jgi:uncharacterized lipoprotein YmbA
LLAACGSSPTVQYYSLSPLQSDYGEAPPDAPRLGIGPFRLPDYLTRSKIVTRASGAEVKIDDYNRWLEPVDDAFHAIVAANVDLLTDDVIAVSFPYRLLDGSERKVVGRVERFDADERGEVMLVLQWAITTTSTDFVLPPRRSVYRAQATDANDYNAIAAAMSDVLEQFSRDIAAAWETINDA